MRNIRLLWGMVGLLGCLVLVLLYLLMASNKEDQAQDDGGAAVVTDPNQAVAKIGKRTITRVELADSLEEQYGHQLIEQMLDREATSLEAKALGITVTDRQIDDELLRMQQGYDSEEQFLKAMKEQLGFTLEQLRKDVYYRLLLEDIAIHDIHITDQMVEEYLAQHPDDFPGGVRVHFMQIVQSSLAEARQTVTDLLNGGDFAALARERSIDEFSATAGGDLGWVDQGDPFIDSSVMGAVQKLQPGEVSAPIKTDAGYAVVKLVARKEPTAKERQRQREAVRRDMALNRAKPLKDIVSSLRLKYKSVILDESLK